MKATELLQSQTSADTQANEELTSEDVTRVKQVEGTPFAIVKENDKWFPVLAEYRLTEEDCETEEEAIKFLYKKDWNTLITVMLTIIRKYNELNEETK